MRKTYEQSGRGPGLTAPLTLMNTCDRDVSMQCRPNEQIVHLLAMLRVLVEVPGDEVEVGGDIGRHVVLVRADLPQKRLRDDIVVGAIASEMPIIDHGAP